MLKDKKLVSIITPTYNRNELLLECVERVRQQTYMNIEHIIIHDGPAIPGFNNWMKNNGIKSVELGFNTSSTLHNSFGIAPLITGMMMANGYYQMWLSDDDEMEPDHIEKLVNLIEEYDVSFVYSKCLFYWKDKDKSSGYIIGTDPPRLGQITNFLYRRSILDWPECLPKFGTHPVDWNLVKQWINCGLTWKMLDEVTFFHRADRVN